MNRQFKQIKLVLTGTLLASWVLCGNVLGADLHVGSGQTYSTIQPAVKAARANDTIYIHGGTYTELVEVDNFSGPLTITLYEADNVTIYPPNSTSGTIYIHGSSNQITIDGKNRLTVYGANAVEDGVVRIASSVGSADRITIKNLTIVPDNSMKAGIILTGTDRCQISGCTFTGSYYRGVEGSSGGSQPTNGPYRLTVRNCTFINPNYAGIEASGTSYWLIEKNYFYRSTSGGQHLIVHRGGSYWKIQNNIFEVRSGGQLNSIAVLRGDSAYSGYNIKDEVYINNTFITTGGTVAPGYGVIFLAWESEGVQNSRFQNNAFIGNWGTSNGIFQYGSGGSGSNNSANYNRKTATDANSPWYPAAGLSGWMFSSNEQGTISYNANGNKPSPYFDITAPYKGSSLNSPPSDDFDGVLRGLPPDVGAFESSGANPSPAPPTGLKIVQ